MAWPSATMLKKRLAVSVLLAALPCSASAADFAKTDARAIGAATVAKEVCTAVFVSGLDKDQFLATNSKFWMHPADRAAISSVDIDRPQKTVTLTAGSVTGKAVFKGAKGCVAYGPDGAEPTIEFSPFKAAGLTMKAPWPAGDKLKTQASAIQPSTLARAYEAAFASDAYTNAFLVVHKGELVAERYALGVTETTRLPGWSIAKTLQSTLVGLMEERGLLSLYSRVPIAAWAAPNDPRRHTTYADLMRMSAPISCGNTQSWHDHDAWAVTGYPESLYVFSGPDDAYTYSIQRPPIGADEPRGVYSNCQPMILGQAISNVLAEMGSDIASFAQKALYGPLGMTSVVMEPDRAGNLLTAGYALATPRDWTRLGLLYANEGMWEGKRLLSPEFMAYVRAPAPLWAAPKYGGQVWLHADQCIFGHCDAYQFNGIEGQRVIIFPSLDLVVARFGFGAGDVPNADPAARRPALEALNAAINILLEDIAPTPDASRTAVFETVKGFFSALAASDKAQLMSLLTEDFRLLEDGEIWSAETLFDKITKPEREERWTLTQPRILVHGDMASIELRNTGAFSSARGRQNYEWVETGVLIKQNGAWRLKSYHSTKLDQVRSP
ncbi:MAG: serine hydrolase [Pseudomonadota bacterium]